MAAVASSKLCEFFCHRRDARCSHCKYSNLLNFISENIIEFSDKWPSFCFPLCPLPMGDDRYFYILSSDVVDAGFFFRCRRCGIPGWSFPVVSKSPPLPGSHITIDRIIIALFKDKTKSGCSFQMIPTLHFPFKNLWYSVGAFHFHHLIRSHLPLISYSWTFTHS